MNIEIKEIESKSVWESFLLKQEKSTFLQSWDWGTFQEKLDRKVFHIGIFNNEELIGVCLTYVLITKFRTHIYTSGGPIIDWNYANDVLPKLLSYLKALAKSNGAKFVRIDPQILDTPENHALFKKQGLQIASTNTQAEKKWILDITPDLETILTNMRKNTRYSVRKAEKQNINSTFSTSPSDFEIFWGLFSKTYSAKHFTPHPKSYYVKQLVAFEAAGNYRLYFSKVDETLLCASLFMFYGNSASYLHAANDNENREFQGAYDMIWQVIKDAKASGIKYLDFWGIAPNDDPKHPWAGFTFFKKGFGGEESDIIRAHDLPVSPMYFIIQLLEGSMKYWGNFYFKIKNLSTKH